MADDKQQVEQTEENQHTDVDMSAVPADVREEPAKPNIPAEDVKQTGHFNYKFYCIGCSGRAFLSEGKDEFVARTCQSCGTTVHYNEANYLPLSDSEKETFNR